MVSVGKGCWLVFLLRSETEPLVVDTGMIENATKIVTQSSSRTKGALTCRLRLHEPSTDLPHFPFHHVSLSLQAHTIICQRTWVVNLMYTINSGYKSLPNKTVGGRSRSREQPFYCHEMRVDILNTRIVLGKLSRAWSTVHPGK